MNTTNKITHIECRAKPGAETVVDRRAGGWVRGGGGGVGGRGPAPFPLIFEPKQGPLLELGC